MSLSLVIFSLIHPLRCRCLPLAVLEVNFFQNLRVSLCSLPRSPWMDRLQAPSAFCGEQCSRCNSRMGETSSTTQSFPLPRFPSLFLGLEAVGVLVVMFMVPQDDFPSRHNSSFIRCTPPLAPTVSPMSPTSFCRPISRCPQAGNCSREVVCGFHRGLVLRGFLIFTFFWESHSEVSVIQAVPFRGTRQPFAPRDSPLID